MVQGPKSGTGNKYLGHGPQTFCHGWLCRETGIGQEQRRMRQRDDFRNVWIPSAKQTEELVHRRAQVRVCAQVQVSRAHKHMAQNKYCSWSKLTRGKRGMKDVSCCVDIE